MAMQLKLSKLISQPNQSFAGALLASALLGSFHPHHLNYASRRYHSNVLHLNQVQQSNDDFIYTPPRSRAFSDLLGS
jgi:hypothetical protein